LWFRVRTLAARLPARVSLQLYLFARDNTFTTESPLTRLTCTCGHGKTQSIIVARIINRIRQRRDKCRTSAQHSSKGSEDLPSCIQLPHTTPHTPTGMCPDHCTDTRGVSSSSGREHNYFSKVHRDQDSCILRTARRRGQTIAQTHPQEPQSIGLIYLGFSP
jgi:hypothetical protein